MSLYPIIYVKYNYHNTETKNMKKILTFSLCLLLFVTNCVNAETEKQNIQFIYINSSNSNDESAKEAYVKGFHTMHKQMKDIFEDDEFIYKNVLNNGKYSVKC